MVHGYISVFSSNVYIGKRLLCFPICFAGGCDLSKMGILLTLLHSERPKLCGSLAIVSPTGLKERIHSSLKRSIFALLGPNVQKFVEDIDARNRAEIAEMQVKFKKKKTPIYRQVSQGVQTLMLLGSGGKSKTVIEKGRYTVGTQY